MLSEDSSEKLCAALCLRERLSGHRFRKGLYEEAPGAVLEKTFVIKFLIQAIGMCLPLLETQYSVLQPRINNPLTALSGDGWRAP
jgi:hypothetical protein